MLWLQELQLTNSQGCAVKSARDILQKYNFNVGIALLMDDGVYLTELCLYATPMLHYMNDVYTVNLLQRNLQKSWKLALNSIST